MPYELLPLAIIQSGTYAAGRILLQMHGRTYRALFKSATAVRTNIEKNMRYTLFTKCAFKRADHRFITIERKQLSAIFTKRFNF
jgi:hypothetical protein